MKKITTITLIMLLTAWLMPLSADAANPNDDVNGDHEVNIADVNAVIDIILSGSGDLTAGDVNGDQEVNLADVNWIINTILSSTAPTQNHEYVNLGLPSGTLWATCNVGATRPEDNGYYFRWGETRPITYYDTDSIIYDYGHYKWFEYDYDDYYDLFTISTILKYNTIDNKTELDPEDDAATVNWGPDWCMPTRAQIEELITECDWVIGDYSAVAYGPNGASLYFPYAAFRYTYDDGTGMKIGLYWSRSLCKPDEEVTEHGEVFGYPHDGRCAWMLFLDHYIEWDPKMETIVNEWWQKVLWEEERNIARSVRAVRVSQN